MKRRKDGGKNRKQEPRKKENDSYKASKQIKRREDDISNDQLFIVIQNVF